MVAASLLRRLALVLLLGTPMATSAACNDKALETPAGSADGGKRSFGAISPEQASKVLAKVGDKTITVGDFVAALEHMDQFDRIRYQSAERRKELLRELINVELLADEAVAKGYDKDALTQQEIRSILRSAMMEKAHAGAPQPSAITAAEVQAYYDGHKDQYRDPERRKVSVIVLPDDANAPAVLDAAKKATTGAKFGELVRAKSVDPAAKANTPIDLLGDYGWVTAKGEAGTENTKAPEEVREVAFQIAAKGDVYDKLVHVKNDAKVYIVRLSEITPAHERTLAEADRAIRVKLVQDKVREREDDLINRLRAENPVQIDDAVLETVRVDLSGAHAPPPGSPGAPSAVGPGAPPPMVAPVAPVGDSGAAVVGPKHGAANGGHAH